MWTIPDPSSSETKSAAMTSQARPRTALLSISSKGRRYFAPISSSAPTGRRGTPSPKSSVARFAASTMRLPSCSTSTYSTCGLTASATFAHQRPWCRRPHQQAASAPVEELEGDPERRIIDVPVPEGELVRGEDRLVLWTPGDDLAAPVEKTPPCELLEYPPDRFDVLGVKCDVGARVVEPVADPLREALPFLLVGEDRLAAALVEPRDAALLDLALVLDAELLLRLDLDRQSVGVPSCHARNVAAAHRLVAADQVLDRTADDVVQTGTSVGGGRPLVEDERLAVDRGSEAPAEGLFAPPGGEHRLL